MEPLGPPLESLPAGAFPMGALAMQGSYPLDDATIDEVVSDQSPGNFALGYLDGQTFTVFYVGRADSDVKARLHAWVGAPSCYQRYAPIAKAAWSSRPHGHPRRGAPMLQRVEHAVESCYTRFAYSYAGSAEEAFEKECRNYADFGGSVSLDNPARPLPSGPTPAERHCEDAHA
jgi:hypothetical protein